MALADDGRQDSLNEALGRNPAALVRTLAGEGLTCWYSTPSILRLMLEGGGLARVDASTPRRMRNPGEAEAVVLIAGGRGGYVGRDGRMLEGEVRGSGPIDADGA